MSGRIRLLLVATTSDAGSEIGKLLAGLEDVDHIVSARRDAEAVARSAEEIDADLVLLALGRVGGNGLDLIADIVRQVPARPLVVLQAEADDALALEAIRHGAQDCIPVKSLTGIGAGGTLRRAVERYRQSRIRHERDTRAAVSTAASGVLDRLPLGVMILDARGQVLITNTKARRIIADGDGLMVDPRSGTFRAENAEQNREMLTLVRRTIQGEIEPDEGCALAITRSSMKQPLCLMVTPLQARGQGDGSRRTGVAIFLSDPEEGVFLEEDVLRDLYGLTRVEARLALGLVRGRQLDELAKETRVSVHTVRSQLKQIFRKTGTNRQAEVVKLMLTGPAAIRIRPSP
jgi:DNA-binding NarL/FixJ family response regulator